MEGNTNNSNFRGEFYTQEIEYIKDEFGVITSKKLIFKFFKSNENDIARITKNGRAIVIY
jgi:hypothetical protein